MSKQILVRLYVGDHEVSIVRLDPEITRVETELVDAECENKRVSRYCECEQCRAA